MQEYDTDNERFNCSSIASSEKKDLTIFCSTFGAWCPIRIFRICPKRQADRVQLTTNVAFDPDVISDIKNRSNNATGVVRNGSVKEEMIKKDSRRNLRYKKGR